MKIGATSDLHGLLPHFRPCDLIVICGDIFPLFIQSNKVKSEAWMIEKFIPWIEKLECKQVVIIAGNHDFAFQDKSITDKLDTSKCKYLCNEAFEYDGIQLFGTPYCTVFGNWPFMVSDETLAKKFSEIPENIDILLSHDAPSLTEVGTIHAGWYAGTNVGSVELSKAIIEKKPKYSLCGHIHSGNHIPEELNGTVFVNVSLVDEQYKETNKIFYFNYEQK